MGQLQPQRDSYRHLSRPQHHPLHYLGSAVLLRNTVGVLLTTPPHPRPQHHRPPFSNHHLPTAAQALLQLQLQLNRPRRVGVQKKRRGHVERSQTWRSRIHHCCKLTRAWRPRSESKQLKYRSSRRGCNRNVLVFTSSSMPLLLPARLIYPQRLTPFHCRIGLI